MGDPRRLRKKYQAPRHPWQSARIEEERVLMRDYGLKIKSELWKANSKLKSFANQAKKLIALRTEQAAVETKQLLESLARLGLLKKSAKLDDVLALNVRNLLDRRLQTLVFKKGLAHSQKQARQYIVHEHILVDGTSLSVPSYIVPVEEEAKISFTTKSSLNNPEHPERTVKPKPKRVKPKVEDNRGRRRGGRR